MEKIFIVGNPNTGKSTLFNSLTKSNEHTGNYHGVTVDAKSKIVKLKGKEYEVFDLPGLYSLNCFSMEEEVAKGEIEKHKDSKILYLINAFNFKRNMYLCLQLIKLGYNIKICINFYDEFKSTGGEIDVNTLSQILGCEVVILNAKKEKLNSKLIEFNNKSLKNNKDFYENKNNIEISKLNKEKNKNNLKNQENIKFFDKNTENNSENQRNNKNIKFFAENIENNNKNIKFFDEKIGNYNKNQENIKFFDENIENNKNITFLDNLKNNRKIKFLEENTNIKIDNYEKENIIEIDNEFYKKINENNNEFYKKINDAKTIEDLYSIIDNISIKIYKNAKKKEKIKLDNYLLKMPIFLPVFIFSMFLALYLIFFLIGPRLSSSLSAVINIFIANPLKRLSVKIFGGGFITIFLEEGVISAGLTLCSFVPQVCMLYIFLNLLEESGFISRMSYMLDDFLNKLGLNGKCVYTMLMGFGCNTSSCFTCKNMPDKNSKIKTALLTPFMSCSAKLPVYTVVATAILGVNNFWLILGLYLLGIVVALLISYLLEKTILKSQNDNFIIEFPDLKMPDIKLVFKTSFNSCKQFVSKVFFIIMSMSVILWLLNNLNFKFIYVTNYKDSMLYNISKSIAWLFKPLGLNSAGMVASLIVGLIAKELIVSSMLIFNKSSSIQSLMYSLTIPTSAMFFTKQSAISFLVFVLLYSPCVSTIAVMLKEIGKKWTVFALILQFSVAYLVTLTIYSICTGSLVKLIICAILMFIIVFAFKLFANKINKKRDCDVKSCKNCVNCFK